MIKQRKARMNWTASTIRQLREDLGLTQPAFAELVDVSVWTLRHWEQGKGPPSRLAQRRLEDISNTERPQLIPA